MKKNLFKILLFSGVMAGLSSCSKSYLQPDPLSFYIPDETFNTKGGLDAAMATCDRHLRSYWTYFSPVDLGLPISTEYMFSDVAVAAKTDDGNIYADIATRLTPNDYAERNYYFWNETYNGIKYANTILTYIDKVPDLDSVTKVGYIGRALFHRSYRYLALAFEFKDVPLVTKILPSPKLNYKSTPREEILKMITLDMEKAVTYVPDQSSANLIGLINKGACRQLLIKCYLATGQWQKAIDQADILIDKSIYSLMTNNFGAFINPYPAVWPITRNVIWDLHRPENKGIAANKEVILVMPNRNGTQSMVKMNSMRNWLPFLDNNQTTTPGGQQAIKYIAKNNINTYREATDYMRGIGRGIAHIRPTYYATNSVWFVNGVNDAGDLRHNSTVGNWARMDSLKYNDVGVTAWYGKNLRLYDGAKILCADTVRNWFDWPHYKYYIEDPLETGSQSEVNHRGGAGDLYCFRLAETYLLRAEAKFYNNQAAEAVADVNKVRQRAGCTELYTTVGIGEIMDERARELNMEEWRFTEMSRVSYCLALSGKADEFGNTYTVPTLEQKSYWYNRIQAYNNYYNKGKVVVKGRSYTLAPHNINWPIPQQNAINANNGAKLHQNPGYNGYDASVEMWKTWQEAVADEGKN